MNSKRENTISGFLLRTFDLKRSEVQPFLMAFTLILTLMTAYYSLRPVRDAFASDWSDAEVSFLWTLNFFISTFLVALYGHISTRIPIRQLVTIVYLFFAASFVVFYWVATAFPNDLVNKSFYLWVSVFALFHISVFWSFMSDIFVSQQAHRLFAPIGIGASVGAILGPLSNILLNNGLAVEQLLLLAAILLILPVILSVYLRRWATRMSASGSDAVKQDKRLEGPSLQGFKEILTQPFLLFIAIFIILYTGIGTFIYFEQKNLLAPFDLETRTLFLSYRDLIVNSLTFFIALFITGRVVQKLGMAVALVSVPALIGLGMMILAFAPILLVAMACWVVRSAGNYGLTRPAREMLFTQVSRDSRFKTKPVIDIVAYRGGDIVMAWFFTLLTTVLQFDLGMVAVVGAVIATCWALVGWQLGKRYTRLLSQQAE